MIQMVTPPALLDELKERGNGNRGIRPGVPCCFSLEYVLTEPIGIFNFELEHYLLRRF